MRRLGRARPVLAIEAPAPAESASDDMNCQKCGTRNYTGPGCWACFNCGTQLREVEDWNPTPAEWFAEVGAYLIDRAAFVPGQVRLLADMTVWQGSDPLPLVDAARARLLPVARRVLLGVDDA